MDFELPASIERHASVGSVDVAVHGQAVSAPARIAVAHSAGPRHLRLDHDRPHIGETPRYRLEIGHGAAELRYFARPTSTDHHSCGRRVVILLSLEAELRFCTDAIELTSSARVPILHSGDARATAQWPAHSWGLVIELPRDGVNAAASALGDARRLASAACALGTRGEDDGFDRAVARIVDQMMASPPGRGAEAPGMDAVLCGSLALRVIAQDRSDALLPPVRSVGEAMRLIREDHRHDFDTEVLATRVGVTAQTLRKGFRSSLGQRLRWPTDRGHSQGRRLLRSPAFLPGLCEALWRTAEPDARTRRSGSERLTFASADWLLATKIMLL